VHDRGRQRDRQRDAEERERVRDEGGFDHALPRVITARTRLISSRGLNGFTM
jgi:hypothetical protein